MKLILIQVLILACMSVPMYAGEAPAFHAVACEGTYPLHVQGICTNERDAIYWSWTDALVKTDANGKVLKQVEVASHHGDLCFHGGLVYVAVNLGKFNEPPGQADSWIYVYDGETLAELDRRAIPEVVHGAGGMAFHEGKFIVVGGLPPDAEQNLLYEYDAALNFQRRIVLKSGYTLKGIQTVAYSEGAWWFGCYGKPKVLLRANEAFEPTGRWEFDGSYGMVPLKNGRFLIGQNSAGKDKEKGNTARLVPAHVDGASGLVLDAADSKGPSKQ